MIFFHAEPLISRFSLEKYITLLQQLWQTVLMWNLYPIFISLNQLAVKITPAESFLWMHLHQFQYLSYQYIYMDSHYKDKMVSWLSYLYNGDPHTWKDCLYIETGPLIFWETRSIPCLLMPSTAPGSTSGIILCVCPVKERQRYNVTSSLIGWVHKQNDPCNMLSVTMETTTRMSRSRSSMMKDFK